MYKPWAKAVRHRAEKKLTQSQIITQKISRFIAKYISLDPIRKSRFDEDLKALGYTQTAEEYMADALTNAMIPAIGIVWLMPLSVPIWAAVTAAIVITSYRGRMKKIEKESLARARLIEAELAQFAGTISQSLKTTQDISVILQSYCAICGDTLREEIQKTLNDLKTGSTEKALSDLEKRVNSAKFSQLVRGLISTYKGEDQQLYFGILAAEFRKNQREIIQKELLARQGQLKPYVLSLLACMILMLGIAVGGYVITQMGVIF